MKLREAASIDLYSNQSFFKWFVVIISVVIGAGSILYTNRLVSEIRDRERKQVDLYAQTLEYLGNVTDMDSDLSFILNEIIEANTTIPVILAGENGTPEYFRNIPQADGLEEQEQLELLKEKIRSMQKEQEPILIQLVDDQNKVYGKKFIYYENSILLTQLRYYPYVQLLIIALFGLVTFTIFNYSRSSEQNRVWVGLAKETAHQLGTPLSSLMAWLEYLKTKYPQEENLDEFDKDISRLNTITSRFSSIGSVPKLTKENIPETIENTVSYLRNRLSDKIEFAITSEATPIEGMINPELFSWVLENLVKNSADAMKGEGKIDVYVHNLNHEQVAVDITDTGMGIPKAKVKQLFRPGYTTKKRGWGLGLTLVKRITENYHKGKIFVKKTEVGKGTTFRILINRFVHA